MANSLFFNKVMWQDYGFDDPYQIVKDGKWTIDKMGEFTKQVTADLNNDGRFTEDDLYGYVTDTHNQIDAYIAAFDVPITRKGADGMPELAVEDEKFVTAFLRLYDFMRENESTFAGTEQPTAVDIHSMYRPIFQNQRGLILAEYLGNSAQMRDYDFDFGILPFPKLDENQDRYKTMSQDGHTIFCIPATAANSEKVGAVAETLAAESYRSVLPAFYEVALKTKFARDEDSSAMIDIIREGISFDFGLVNVVLVGRPHHVWRSLITGQRNNVVSEVERGMRVWSRDLESLLEAYE
jgi:ABC-type glycerol-3-phosphate transport system substrate-binding protein